MGELTRLGDVDCYRAEPDGESLGTMVLIHEIWGLTSHIRSVADRAASEGWTVLAPDILSSVGTTPELGDEISRLRGSDDEAERLAVQPRLREAFAAPRAPGYAAWALAQLVAMVDTVSDPGVVAVGFCFGGGYAMELAAEDPRIRAAVSFYGSPLAPDRLARLRSPLLSIYGDRDERLMDTLDTFVRDAEAAGVDLTTRVYPGAAHAFFNDTGANYDAEAAEDAWATATAFLDRVVPSR